MAQPKKRGRPRTKPIPEPVLPRTIKVYRKIPGSEEVRLTATHENVPGDWTHAIILSRLGIREHLKVTATTGSRTSVLQDFK